MHLLMIALGFTFTVSAYAGECGQSLRRPDIAKLAAAARDSNSNLLQHMRSLTLEWQAVMEDGPASAKVRSELDRVRHASDYSRELQHSLSRAEMLTQLRDVMRDPKDKQVVYRYLSVAAAGTRELNEIVRQSVGELLTSTSRPGVAVDISRLRDIAKDTATLFDNCEPPKPVANK